MTTFIYEIEATKDQIVNLGKAETLEAAFEMVKSANLGKQTLVTIQKLEVIPGRYNACSFEHVETFEFETV